MSNRNPADDLISAVVDHVVHTLPDSYSRRLSVLNGLLEILPKTHQTRVPIEKLADGLISHELAQREFPFAGGAR